MIQLGEFLPDVGDLNNPGLVDAKNVFPEINGYSPFYTIEAVATALPTEVQGAASYRAYDGNAYTFVADSDHLYRFSSVSWANVSNQEKQTDFNFTTTAGNYVIETAAGDFSFLESGDTITISGSVSNDGDYTISTATVTHVEVAEAVISEAAAYTVVAALNHGSTINKRFEFVRYNDTVVGVNLTVYPQVVPIDGASTFTHLTTDVKARHVGVIRDFMVLGNTWDAVDGSRPNRLRWSAIGDATDWTVSSVTQSGFVDLVGDIGDVRFVSSGEYGIIITQRSVFRMTYVGAPTIFQMDEIFPSVGAYTLYGQAQHGNRIFFLARDGFKMIVDGVELVPIGSNKVDNWFRTFLNIGSADEIHCAIDPTRTRVYWAAPFYSCCPDVIVAYDWVLNKWSYVDQQTQAIFTRVNSPINMDSMDALYPNLDLLDISLDDPYWQGNIDGIAYFNGDNELSTSNGIPRTAMLETGEAQLYEDRKALINNVQVNSGGGDTTIEIRYRDTLNDFLTSTGEKTVSRDNFIPVRASGRFFKMNIKVDGRYNQIYNFVVNSRPVRRKF